MDPVYYLGVGFIVNPRWHYGFCSMCYQYPPWDCPACVMLHASAVSSSLLFKKYYFFSLQPREMRANHNPTVRQHCVQSDHLAKPAWAQQAGAGGHGGPPVLSPGQGPVLPPPTNLPMFCLCPCLHNPRGSSSTVPQPLPCSSRWLRRVDEQVWFPMAGQPCLSHLSCGW